MQVGVAILRGGVFARAPEEHTFVFIHPELSFSKTFTFFSVADILPQPLGGVYSRLGANPPGSDKRGRSYNLRLILGAIFGLLIAHT